MTELTPEQLDMLKRLQPFFKGKMGKLQHGDEVELALSKETHFYCIDCLDNSIYSHRLYDNCIRIPKAIDWQNPERGLWGMVDWTKQHGKIMPDGNVWIFSIPYFEHHRPKFKADPFTALLKALVEQEAL